MTDGIKAFDPASQTLGVEFTGIPGKGYAEKSKVLESGVLNVTDGTDNFEIAYYQRPGSVGFGYSKSSAPGGWEWKDLYDQFNDPDGPNLSDLKKLIEDNTSKLIADSQSCGSYGYILIPAINNVRVYAGLRTSLEALDDTADDFYSKAMDVFVGVDGANVIKANTTAAKQSVSQIGSYLFLGTSDGLYSTTVNADGVPAGTAAKIDLKRTADIVRIRSKEIDSSVWTAALGRAGNLFLLQNGALVKTYRFHTGLPSFTGNLKKDAGIYGDIFWTDAGLMVSGVNGAVLLKNADLGK
jgi:hypothetical protein